MRVRSLVAALALAAAAVGTPGRARAAPQGAPSAANVAEARKLFDTGLKLYNEGSYREALAAFLHANELAPRASIQRNIAQCHRDLKDFSAAYDAYRTLLAKYGAAMSAAEKRPIERAIDELALLTGTVRVLVSEAGAAIAVDGHDAGVTPIPAAVRLNLGPHTVTVTKAGFETIQKEVKLNGGDEVTVDGPLQPEVTTGHLVVDAPADAQVEVFVDGADVGPAPWEGDVKPGVHVVEARGTDRLAAPKPIEVARRERAVLALELVARTGRVQIDTHTTEASIAIDGKMVARGIWEGLLSAGEHRMTIEAPGFHTYTRAFLVHEGETFVEDARLVADDALAPARYEGIYSGLAFLGFSAPGGATHDIAVSCPNSTCQSSAPLGAGLAVRVGYAFGWLAAEGLALGSYDYSNGSVEYMQAPARKETYDFHRFGGGGALGVRVASKHPHVRLTAAVLGGLVTMGNIYKQVVVSTTTSNSTTNTSEISTYVAPLLVTDAGVLVGFANGAKLHVSVAVMTQFVGDPVKAPAVASQTLLAPNDLSTPALGFARGTQVFLGPMIGFDFGL
jgi:hypothetical protein